MVQLDSFRCSVHGVVGKKDVEWVKIGKGWYQHDFVRNSEEQKMVGTKTHQRCKYE